MSKSTVYIGKMKNKTKN